MNHTETKDSAHTVLLFSRTRACVVFRAALCALGRSRGCNAHLEVVAELVDLSPVLAADPLAARAAVARVVAHVDAGGGQCGALCPRAHRALRRALTLRAVLRVQEVPLTHIVHRAVRLTRPVLPGHRQAKDAQHAEQKGPESQPRGAAPPPQRLHVRLTAYHRGLTKLDSKKKGSCYIVDLLALLPNSHASRVVFQSTRDRGAVQG